MNRSLLGFLLCVLCVLCGENSSASANPPTASYIFPAGAQRGTSVDVRVGGLFLHDKCDFHIVGSGITHSPHLTPAKRIWFEGPLLPIPESQQQEDYPADMQGKITVAKDAPPGERRVQVFTSQGGAGGPVFIVGELPEVIEKEIDGEPIPVPIKLPVTANGRIFPREDVDLWEFDAEAGKTVTAFVHTKSIKSPLVTRLDILDSSGKVIAEEMLHPCIRTDGSVKFTPKVSGKYRVRIRDARTLGGPAYVYRLTVTTENVPAFHYPIRVITPGVKEILPPQTGALAPPVALHGQIEKAGAVTEWKVDLKKGEKYTFELQARKFDSPLCGVFTLYDATGKELAKGEASETADPPRLPFTTPADGTYTLKVREKFRGRGGENFVYRLVVWDTSTLGDPSFSLAVATDVFTVQRGAAVKVKVTAERHGGFAGPIEIKAQGLPEGIEMKPVTMNGNQNTVDLTITAGPKAIIGAIPLKLQGSATINGKVKSTEVDFAGRRWYPGDSGLRLVVAFPTPFKIIDQYVMTNAPRGETYRRKYKVDRGGFDGPIQIQLAEKQARHLQGVTGPVIVLKPGETEFEYPAFLPPWMELGRTCRVCVMATAKVKDPVDGREHTVSFSSVDQNQQMIVVVGPGRLGVSIDKTSVRAEGEVKLAVKVSRSKNLTGPATVELVLPDHIRGVSVSKLVVAADSDTGELVLKFESDTGPFNMPLVVRATISTDTGPVTAETKVEVVK
ncbi:MAG: hypothetical protein L0241_15095 [Planctomycetia bacterium]|nr:hypothetical protein [Planctomycetia bacterium]